MHGKGGVLAAWKTVPDTRRPETGPSAGTVCPALLAGAASAMPHGTVV